MALDTKYKQFPKIAVILIAHDRKDFILRALKSIENQTKKADEIVVVKSFQDETIDRMIREYNAINIFTTSAPEGDKIREALGHVKSDIICLLEDDDQFSPDKLTRIWHLFQDNVVYVHNNLTLIDDDMKNLDPKTVANFNLCNENLRISSTKRLSVVRELIGIGMAFNVSSISARRDILDLGFLTRVSTGIDEMIFVKSIERGTVSHTSEKLTIYRYHHPKLLDPIKVEKQYADWIDNYTGSLWNFLKNSKTHLANRWARSVIRRLKIKRMLLFTKKIIRIVR